MTEQKFLTQLQKWLRANSFPTCVIEAKVAKGKRLPYSALKPHQFRNLRNARKSMITYKIPDDGFGQKPFDCVVFNNVPGYVAVMFYEKKGTKDFYLIPAQAWRFAEVRDTEKSLTPKKADIIGIHGVLIT